MYSAEISRGNPTCFLFLIDQSGSMQDVMDPTNVQAMDKPLTVDGREYTHTATGRTKAQALADIVNRLLQEICIRCAKEEGIRDYFHIGVIGYGAQVGPAFSGTLAGRELAPISLIADNPARVDTRTKKVEDGAGGLVDQTVRFPIWFDPVANGGTPMCQAFGQALQIVQNWLAQHPNCFPPIVINITDGESTDGDPTGAAGSLKSLSSSDGAVLLFNLHLSSQQARPIEFPSSAEQLPDQYAKLLFQMSSQLTPFMISVARQMGYALTDGAKGFTFNADKVATIHFLEIGTKPGNLR